MTDQEICVAIMNRTRADMAAKIPEPIRPLAIDADEMVTKLIFLEDGERAAKLCVKALGNEIRDHICKGIKESLMERGEDVSS